MYYADGAYSIIAPGTVFMYLGDYKELPAEPTWSIGTNTMRGHTAGSARCFWKILLDEKPVWLFSSYRDKHMIIGNIVELRDDYTT